MYKNRNPIRLTEERSTSHITARNAGPRMLKCPFHDVGKTKAEKAYPLPLGIIGYLLTHDAVTLWLRGRNRGRPLIIFI